MQAWLLLLSRKYNYSAGIDFSLLEKTQDYVNKIFKINNNSPLGFRLLGFMALAQTKPSKKRVPILRRL